MSEVINKIYGSDTNYDTTAFSDGMILDNSQVGEESLKFTNIKTHSLKYKDVSEDSSEGTPITVNTDLPSFIDKNGYIYPSIRLDELYNLDHSLILTTTDNDTPVRLLLVNREGNAIKLPPEVSSRLSAGHLSRSQWEVWS